ncbi:MAG: LexA family protein [Cellvibrionaceae bacterium]
MNTKNVNEDYGKRLKQALSNRGIGQSELARRAGIKPQSVQYLCAGKGQGSTHTNAFAKILGVDPDWLASGVGHMAQGPVSAAANEIPLLKWEDLLSEKAENEETISIAGTATPGAFALLVEGNAMSSSRGLSIPENSTIVVDPRINTAEEVLNYGERTKRPTLVIAKVAEDAMFRLMVRDGSRYSLETLKNADSTPFNPLKDRILGVVTQALILF